MSVCTPNAAVLSTTLAITAIAAGLFGLSDADSGAATFDIGARAPSAAISSKDSNGPDSLPDQLAAGGLRILRLDDSLIDVYVAAPPSGDKAAIALVLQGSECTSVAPGGDRFPLTLPAGVVRMDIEKYGISPTSQRDGDACPADYLANNTVDGRVLDVLIVLAHLRTNAEWWDGRLFVTGASEGATVAAIVGSLAAETHGLILINGSIGRPFREGWSDAVASAVRDGGGSADDVEAARSSVDNTWVQARATPTTELYEGPGNTLRWWRSIIDLRPLNLLQHIDAPILLMQSELDQMTPVASARAAAERLGASGAANFIYVELPGLDHGFRDAEGQPHYGPVLARIDQALAEQVAAATP